MKKGICKVLLCVMAGLLISMAATGCAQLATFAGVQPAQSFDQRVAYGVGMVAGVRTSAAHSLADGVITVDDAKYVLGLTDQARAGLDAASLAQASADPNTAAAKLALATNILTQLQAYLLTRGVK